MRKFLPLLAVLVMCSLLAAAQSKVVTGRVTDSQGQPIPFSTIRVKGGKQGTSADADGNFSIKVNQNETLVVSGTGIVTKEVPVTGNSLTVQVTRKDANLTEVVVTALGIQRQAKELGYSTSKVQGKEIVQAKPISVANGLTGKVSGLQINTVNNGLFADTRITLRGNRSLTGNNQPLVVVDGAIFYNDINTLNPEDIADINVLKGSSASAVYGSDASNGVLLITTKHGTRGKPNLTFSTTAQLETVSYLPSYQTRFGSNGGERFVNDPHDLSSYIPYENQQYGPEYNGALVPLGRPVFDGTTLIVPYSPIKNQKKDFFDKAWTTQNNISYSAGDENSRFYLSLQDISSKAVMPGDKGRRDVFRVGGSKTYGIFTANYSLSYTYKSKDVTNTGEVYQNLMNTPVHVPLSRLKDINSYKYATLDGYYNDYFDNPYWTIANRRNKTTDHNLTGNVGFVLKPVSWLTATYRLSMNNSNSRYEYVTGEKKFSNFALNYDTVLYAKPDGSGFDSVAEAGKYTANFPEQASYITSSFNNFLVTSDFILAFNKDISRDFNIQATAGTTYIENKLNANNVNAGSLFFPVYNIQSRTGNPSFDPGQNGVLEARKLGYFGEATVGFKGYAFVHGSYRTDIDSRLSKDNRFIPYYDVDASLVISDMFPSLAQNKVLNFLKIRGAHSVTGNASALANGSQFIGFGAYATTQTFASVIGSPYSGIGAYQLNTVIANPGIKPETVTENELGLEFSLLQNRITVVTAAYKSKLTDGIVYAQIARSSGFNSALVNAANTENKGLEIEVRADVLKTKNVTWRVSANYTYNQSKVLNINGGATSLGLSGPNGNSFAVVGQPFPVIETRDWVRDPNGHVIVDPISGNPSRDGNLKILGQASPKNIVGISTSVTWKNFSFSATADYRGGHKIFNSIGQYQDFTGVGEVTASTGRQRFVFPNSVIQQGDKYIPNTNVTVDDANFNFWPGLYRNVGANYVISAAAWKLREVSIVYTLPRKVVAPLKVVSSASLTLSGRNLIMIRPKTNQWTDPEFNEDTGNDIGRTSENQSPPTRIYSATLSITF